MSQPEYPVKPGDFANPKRHDVMIHSQLDGDPWTGAQPAGDSHWFPPSSHAIVLATTRHMFNHPMNAHAYVLSVSKAHPMGQLGWVRVLDLVKVEP